MARRVRVFVGPTLPLLGRPLYPELEFRPPAIRGDFKRAIDDEIEIAGLIDGEFRQNLAVTPTEIRLAAQHGIKIFGASSLGALRAVECPDCVVGVGQIVQMFRTEQLQSDDEVAGTYRPDTFETISHPLVNIRHALDLTLKERPLSMEVDRAGEVLARIKELPYADRTTDAVTTIVRSFLSSDGADRFGQILKSPASNLKRADALCLLEQLKKLI